MDRLTLTRAASLYVPLALAAIGWIAAPPTRRERAAAFLATAWNVPALLALQVVAVRMHWWSYRVTDGTVAGFPIDLYVGWMILWGALPALLARRLSLWLVVGAAIVLDVVAMPQLTAVVRLETGWLVGEVVAIAICLVPAQLLATWTRQNTHVGYRASLQATAFAGIALGVLPTVILERTAASWLPLFSRPGWVTGILLQLIALAGLLGMSAVQEFATRGSGTPVPFDPPKRLVVSGPYAYVRNPMQLSAALVMLAWGGVLESPWVAAAGLMAVVYGAGFAAGDERTDLERRFGARWSAYGSRVRPWIPRWRPVDPLAIEIISLGSPGPTSENRHGSAATLYVSEECGPCSEVRAWFAARDPIGLEIVAAERHPTRSLTRITYGPGDGTTDCEGIAALGRALEHVHLGWALIGMFVRLPGVVWLLQAVTDASGGSPRRVVRYCERPAPG